MPDYLQRKYTDLIRQVSSKWVNWDPSIEIKVGAYGSVDNETGDLRVEGTIYAPEFQVELDKHGIKMCMSDFLPQEGSFKEDFIVASRGAKRSRLNVDREVDVSCINRAVFNGQWLFKHGMRDAVLIMHRPRQFSLPPKMVLEPLYRVDKLIDKWLVTSIYVCHAYCMYLSDKSGDKASFALASQSPFTVDEVESITGANGGLSWWADAQTGLLRKACDTTGSRLYTPLLEVKHPIGRVRKFCRTSLSPYQPRDDLFEPEPSGDDLWITPFPPWEPLDEDGEEDPIDVSMQDTEPM